MSSGISSIAGTRVRDAIIASVSTFTVPGAQVAWLCDGSIEQIEVGGIAQGRPGAVRTGTRFPLGSVTKVFTASLALQLVGDGLLGLDEPIAGFLPRGASRECLGEVTLRQLLSHTSGVESDHSSGSVGFGSTREYVRALAGERLLFSPGEHFSYANAGYLVIGHLIEARTGLPWAEALQAYLLDPLELRGTFFLSEPVGPGVMADGHVRRHDGAIVRLPVSSGRREWAPAAGLALNAAGLLRLVQLHLAGGRTQQGFQLLEPALVSEMRTRHVTVPDPSFADAWGLGWALLRSGAAAPGADSWFGHDGDDEGWTAYVRASAHDGFAVAMLANCLPAHDEWRRLVRNLGLAGLQLGDTTLPELPQHALPIDPSTVGSYENGSSRLVVLRRDGEFWLELGTAGRQERLALKAIDSDRCLAVPGAAAAEPMVVAFLRDRDGCVQHMSVGGRIVRRVRGSATG